jgi:hypothetical protein
MIQRSANTSTGARLWRGTLLATAAAALLACTATLSLDDDRLEQVIQEGILSQAGVTVSQVTCPEDTPIAQGNVSQCTATTSDGQQLTIEVTQTDAAGNVNWRVI